MASPSTTLSVSCTLVLPTLQPLASGSGVGYTVINYNTAKQTLRCIASLAQCKPAPAWILVLDNAANVLGTFDLPTTGVELVGGVSARSARTSLASVQADAHYAVEFRFVCALNPEVCFLNVGVVGDVDGILHRITDITLFRVMPDAENLATGIVDFGCTPELELIADSA